MMLGNYNGNPSHAIPVIVGIAHALGVTTLYRAFPADETNVQMVFAPGCSIGGQEGYSPSNLSERTARSNAVAIAKDADPGHLRRRHQPVRLENEGVDRAEIELPATQTALLKDLKATGKPLVFVNCSGSAIAMPWEAENLSAIVQAWYPGQEGGTAVADVLFGDVNPAGRLPVTFYRSTADLPDYTNYDMANRTYRYFTGKPLFAFGHGLSYTTFDYKSVQCDQAKPRRAAPSRSAWTWPTPGRGMATKWCRFIFGTSIPPCRNPSRPCAASSA